MTGRRTPTKAIILGTLTEGSARLSYLRELTNASEGTIRMAISRLREEGFSISCERDPSLGDPKYALAFGPASLIVGKWLCPKCHALIEGKVSDHKESCEYGPANFPERIRHLTGGTR